MAPDEVDLMWVRVTACTGVGRVEATVVASSAAEALVMVGDLLRRQHGVDQLGPQQDWRATCLPGNPGDREGVVILRTEPETGAQQWLTG